MDGGKEIVGDTVMDGDLEMEIFKEVNGEAEPKTHGETDSMMVMETEKEANG